MAFVLVVFASCSLVHMIINMRVLISHNSLVSHACARFGQRIRCNTHEQRILGRRWLLLLQHIEKVLPGGILHAPVAVGKHAQSRAAQADRWQLPASACHLTKCFGVRACGLLQTWSFIRILYALNERESNKLYSREMQSVVMHIGLQL